jgi:hypothetical protein
MTKFQIAMSSGILRFYIIHNDGGGTFTYVWHRGSWHPDSALGFYVNELAVPWVTSKTTLFQFEDDK